MQEPSKRSAAPPTIKTAADNTERRFKNDPDDLKVKTVNKHVIERTPTRAQRKKGGAGDRKSGLQTGIVVANLKPINRRIPFNRTFIHVGSSHDGMTATDQGFLKSFTKNVKGLFEGVKTKGLEKEELVRLRLAVGSLKNAKEQIAEPDPGTENKVEENRGAKSKKELLEEKRKALDQQSKTAKKTGNTTVGMRIEIERLKKKFPDDPNLALMSAILTAKDTCSVHRPVKEQISSLYAALQEAGAVVFNDYLTTYSIDVLFDIYFLYLDTLKAKLLADLKSVKPSESDSLRRDIRVLNLLLDQKRQGKSIANVAKKLDGFGYPFESLSPIHVAKTFQSTNEEGDERIGPGTAKLNKFLIRIYLNVFSQIPAFQPLARKFCDVLPNNRQSRAMIANVNLENAVIKFKIAKLNKSMELHKMIMSIYNYGKSFIGTNFAETVTSPLEAKMLLRIAQMVEEMGLISVAVDPAMVTYGYKCATVALHYHKEEAEALLIKISDVAARQRLSLN